jgi:hypothetical protein
MFTAIEHERSSKQRQFHYLPRKRRERGSCNTALSRNFANKERSGRFSAYYLLESYEWLRCNKENAGSRYAVIRKTGGHEQIKGR